MKRGRSPEGVKATFVNVDMTGLPIKINFQVDGTRPQPGYLVDSGDEYDARPSGFAYGWSLDHRNMDRQRGLHGDPRLDSLVHFRQNGAWWIALDGGSYDVTVSIGDPAYASTHTINVNGVSFWDNYHLPKNTFATMTRTIHIHEGGGDIYIDQGLAANLATRINYIEITPAGDPPPPGTPVVTIGTQNADGNNDNQAFEAGSDPAWFTIHRSGDTSEELTVYLTASGAADVSDFHQPIPQSWKISAGDSSSYFYLVPRDDNFAEPPEQLTLSISTNASYVRGTPASATVTVFDNDTPPPGQFALIASALSSTEIALSWTELPEADLYALEVSDESEFFQTIYLTTAAGEATVEDLEPGSSFKYRITAFNGNNELAQSNIAGATTFVASSAAMPAELPAPASGNPNRLVSFFGAGATDGQYGFGNTWLKQISDDAGGTIKQDSSPYLEKDYYDALYTLLADIDADGDNIIDQSEAATSNVQLLGYSLGGISAINLSRRLTDNTITRIGRPTYTLQVDVPVNTLVAIDPVNAAFLGTSWVLKHANGPVKSNVLKYRGYWRTRTGEQRMDFTIAGVPAGWDDMGTLGGRNIMGSRITSHALDSQIVRMEQQRANSFVIHLQYPQADPRNQGVVGEMVGSSVGHDTMPWFLWEEVLAELQT